MLYTDGACSGNPGPGGWGVLLEHGDHKKELCGGEANTTNNRMEMKAVIEGLRALKTPCEVTVCSDSALIINAFQQDWIGNWKRKNWKKSNNKPVENQDLWHELLAVMEGHTVHWKKVKGHAGDPRNERVDALAVQAASQVAN